MKKSEIQDMLSSIGDIVQNDIANPLLDTYKQLKPNKNNSEFLKYAGAFALGPLALIGYLTYKGYLRKSRKSNLKDKVVVITGASTGIGKDYAYEFAKAGSKVVLAARSTDKIEELALELETKFNVETLAVTTDVSRQEECNRLIESSIDKFGHVDILINNAGIITYGYFHETSTEDMKKLMEVNYWGTVYCIQAVLPSMIKRGQGKIVNVSSFLGKRGMPVMGAYSATKFAIGGLSESLRVELKKFGIDVTLICPTSTRTELVNNALHHENVKLSSNVGMSSKRVAKETVSAILDNKREHILGVGENVAVQLNGLLPSVMDKALEFAPKFILKDK